MVPFVLAQLAGQSPTRRPQALDEAPYPGTAVAHLPEPRPHTVAQEPEPRCPAPTGIAQAERNFLILDVMPNACRIPADGRRSCTSEWL